MCGDVAADDLDKPFSVLLHPSAQRLIWCWHLIRVYCDGFFSASCALIDKNVSLSCLVVLVCEDVVPACALAIYNRINANPYTIFFLRSNVSLLVCVWPYTQAHMVAVFSVVAFFGVSALQVNCIHVVVLCCWLL